MLSAAIAYQVLRQENPGTIADVRVVLASHPWFTTQWKKGLTGVPAADRDLMLFMLAARWPDDARGTPFHRGNWHYINLPFKPSGEPANVQEDPASAPNVLTALADNESTVRNDPNADRRAVAMAWLFHLVGDVHQPLHTTQLFTLEYPDGDRGGNEICIRVKPKNRPIALHKFWDDMLTGSEKLTVVRNLATGLRNRPDFAKSKLTELGNTDVEIWAKESFTQGVTIAYRNGTFRGTQKGHASDCADLQIATVLPSGYITTAKPVAERRMILAGYRLADFLTRVVGN